MRSIIHMLVFLSIASGMMAQTNNLSTRNWDPEVETSDPLSITEEESAAEIAAEMPGLLEKLSETGDPDTVINKKDTTIIQIKNVRIIIKGSDEDFDISIDEETDEDSDSDEDMDEYGEHEHHFDHNEKSAPENVTTRWLMLDLGVNAYLNNGSMALPEGYRLLELNAGKSIEVDLHLFKQRVNLIRHHLNLIYGLSFQFNNYRFSNNVSLLPKQSELTFEPLDDPVKKSKLADTYVNVPIMLNVETNPMDKDRSFRINLGGYAGYLLEAHTKVKYTDNKKVKTKDDFNLNKFQYGLKAQIGYGWFNVFGRYSLTSLLNEGEGPDLTPVSVGVTLIGF